MARRPHAHQVGDCPLVGRWDVSHALHLQNPWRRNCAGPQQCRWYWLLGRASRIGEGGRLTAIWTVDEIYFCVPVEDRCLPADLGGGVRKEQRCWRQGKALLIGEGGRLTAVLNVAGIRFCVPVKGRYQLEGLGGGEIRLCG